MRPTVEQRRIAELALLKAALVHANAALDEAHAKLRKNLKHVLAHLRGEIELGIPAPERLVADAQDAFDKSLLVDEINTKIYGPAVRSPSESSPAGVRNNRHQSIDSVLLALGSVEYQLAHHRSRETQSVLEGCDELLKMTPVSAIPRGAQPCPNGYAVCEPGTNGLCECGFPC
jgi:hypothetical protein